MARGSNRDTAAKRNPRRLDTASGQKRGNKALWEARIAEINRKWASEGWRHLDDNPPAKTPLRYLIIENDYSHWECVAILDKPQNLMATAFWRPWKPETAAEWCDTRIALRRKLNGDTR